MKCILKVICQIILIEKFQNSYRTGNGGIMNVNSHQLGSVFYGNCKIYLHYRSKDPNTQVGACIVNAENKIVGVG